MIGRHDVSDREWSVIAPLLPNKPRGVARVDDRRVISGIFYILRTGAPWRDLPERYGPWQTCHARLVRWRRDGTWDRLLAHAQTESDAVGEVVWEVSIDSTTVRAHQHAAGARKKGAVRTRPRRRPTRRSGAAAAA